MTDYLKKTELLQETNRDFDFFNFGLYAKNLHKSLRSNRGPTVTMLIGAYGTGKSVLLNEVNKISDQSQAKNKPTWVFFECWQYPDKRDLWEALIVELVEKIEGKTQRDKMLEAYSDTPSWRNNLTDFLKHIEASVVTIITIFMFSFFLFNLNNEFVTNLLLSLAIAFILVLLASIEYTIRPESKSSISRLSDYKRELERVLMGHRGTLYIVLEDVDRAGELGVRFFETVAHFIKDSSLKQKSIKIIVPISSDTNNKELQDSIEKVSDNVLYFKPRYSSEKFLSEVFSDEFLDAPTKQMLLSIINPLLGRQISVRKMKHTLRNAITKYKRLKDSDFNPQLAICIAIEFSKYMQAEIGSSTLYDSAGNRYKHKPLFDWATQKGLVNTSSDDPEKEIEPRDYFKSSPDIFDDIRYADNNSGMSRSKPIYNRDYLISRAYFDDL